MTKVNLEGLIKEKMPLTLGQVIEIADEAKTSPTEIIIMEAQIQTGKTRDRVLDDVMAQFEHNLKAVEIGMTTGGSLLFGKIGAELSY